MSNGSLVKLIGAKVGLLRNKKGEEVAPPVLAEMVRFPYGAFRFRTQLPAKTEYSIYASSDLKTWAPLLRGVADAAPLEYVDSQAFKFSYRFYRLQAGQVFSRNVIGYASVTLAPGFSMVANPFEGSAPVGDLFKGWPDGTSINRFDTTLFRLVENKLERGRWSKPSEHLRPGDGAIFFNPTSDYKSVSFTGDVMQGNLSVPIPAGFSVRSSLVPQPGHLADDLKFPITEGDVVHLFDRDQQKYMLHPYENGKWTAGPPILGVGESFWIAKTKPGNWTRSLVIEG